MKNNKEVKLGEEKFNNQNCLMKIVEYNSNKDIVVEFQDRYNAKVNTNYNHFIRGYVKNPYYPSVCGVGMVGNKYHTKLNKECNSWKGMIRRCFNDKEKERYPTYKDVTCCDGWLLFDNFYEWLHSQENFDKWLNGDKWCLDKDILTKGNKVYSPETCCLVPQNVNNLFVKKNAVRGNFPIGVSKNGKSFQVKCQNMLLKKHKYLGAYPTPEAAFQVYKEYKENLIKQTAQEEYFKGNITKRCYEAMMKYEVEITD